MKIRSVVYKQIRDKLLSSMSCLQYVDIQKGQMNNKTQNYPIPLPACLIEFQRVSWSETTGGQLGDATVSLYLYLDHVTDSFNGAEQENKTIELLDKQDIIHESMQGYAGECFNPLKRVSDSIMEYKDRYLCFRIDFQTTLFQNNPEQKTGKKTNIKFNFQ
jgi:hypothetical protein